MVYFSDIDETVSWINEKASALASDDFGRDLASVQALQRKHDGVERDLAALELKVQSLGVEADRLKNLHPDRSDHIDAKRQEVLDFWEQLKEQAQNRKEQLDRSYALHRFYADYRDLLSWINEMKAVIAADELAKDVAGAEALLERHQEHRVRIRCRYR